MKTLVYFVRHAETDYTVRDDVKRPLTKKGIEDTKRVTKVLADKGISRVYSSPFQRSVDTIKDFADSYKLEITTDENFRERNVGVWVEDFQGFSKKQWEDFDYKLEVGESLREVQQRNMEALFEVIKSNRGKNIAIATHGTALSTIINYFKPAFGHEDFWAIVDKMPYILCFKFEDMILEAIEEIELL